MMERILIIGCGGSGKSTLARALAQRLGLPVCHLDQLYWKSGWENVSQEEFDDRLQTALALPQWIMDDNFERTVTTRIQRCDALIVLDYSRATCLFGVLHRWFGYLGKTRPDMPTGCPERIDAEFLRWIWHYPTNNRPRMLQAFQTAEQLEKRTLCFSNRKACYKWLSTLPTCSEKPISVSTVTT